MCRHEEYNHSLVHFCLIFFGIANDVELRQFIRKALLDKSKLLDNIADAQIKSLKRAHLT
jgi:hypothetical protein